MTSKRRSGDYPSIVFFGTPPFASKVLDHLMLHHVPVKGVVTAPDKPSGRGRKMVAPAVKDTALSYNLPVLQPVNLKDPVFQEDLRNLNPELQVVVAFRMLPQSVWDMPVMGTFNLHASLLPQYRGAAPIQWALINGEHFTGVTTFLLQHEIDTGKIILQEKIPIETDDDAGSLTQKMLVKGTELVVRTIDMITQGDIAPVDQHEIYSGHLKTAPKLTKQDTIIHWDRSPREIHNLVRAMSPSPGAIATITLDNGKQTLCKILKTELVPGSKTAVNPTFYSDKRSFLEVITMKGVIRILELQLEGKKRMAVAEFLRGFDPGKATINAYAG